MNESTTLSPKDYFPKLVGKLTDKVEIKIEHKKYTEVYVLIPDTDLLRIEFRQDDDTQKFHIDQQLFAIYYSSGKLKRGPMFNAILDYRNMFENQFNDLMFKV